MGKDAGEGRRRIDLIMIEPPIIAVEISYVRSRARTLSKLPANNARDPRRDWLRLGPSCHRIAF